MEGFPVKMALGVSIVGAMIDFKMFYHYLECIFMLLCRNTYISNIRFTKTTIYVMSYWFLIWCQSSVAQWYSTIFHTGEYHLTPYDLIVNIGEIKVKCKKVHILQKVWSFHMEPLFIYEHHEFRVSTLISNIDIPGYKHNTHRRI